MDPNWIDIDGICEAVEDESQDIEDVRTILELAFDLNHPDALFSLAMWALDGEHGIEKSSQESLRALERSSSVGHAGASFNLGLIYELGKFTEADARKSRQYYFLAAIRGHSKAVAELADENGVCSGLTLMEIVTISKAERVRLNEMEL